MATRVYLSGKMGGRSGTEVLNERRKAIQLCMDHGLIPIDPGRNESIEDTKEKISLKLDFNMMKHYVAKDEYMVAHCHVLLVLSGDYPSDGTWWEMGQAHWAHHIPVVMVAPERAKGNIVGFSNIKADALFATVEEAIKYIADNYSDLVRGD